MGNKHEHETNKHFQISATRAKLMGGTKAKVHSHSKTGKAETLGKRVWNLTNKGQCFERMVQPEKLMQVVGAVLGNDFCLGSFAANALMTGAGH